MCYSFYNIGVVIAGSSTMDTTLMTTHLHRDSTYDETHQSQHTNGSFMHRQERQQTRAQDTSTTNAKSDTRRRQMHYIVHPQNRRT
jgi:hypothetical protein